MRNGAPSPVALAPNWPCLHCYGTSSGAKEEALSNPGTMEKAVLLPREELLWVLSWLGLEKRGERNMTLVQS